MAAGGLTLGMGAGPIGKPSVVPTLSFTTDLVLQLDAENAAGITLVSSRVSNWSDDAGTANDASQGTASARPDYKINAWNGLNAVKFDGDNQGLVAAAQAEISNVFAGGAYIAVVVQPAGAINAKMIQKGPATPYWVFTNAGAGPTALKLAFQHDFDTLPGVWLTDNDVVSTGYYQLLEVEYDSDSTANDPILRVNGIIQDITESVPPSGAVTDDSGGDITVGNRSDLFFGEWGTFAEILIYSSIPSGANQDIVRAYLQSKWGV